MMLSEHFSLAELIASSAALRLGIDNVPREAEVENLRRLCVEILEPLRAEIGRPVVVTSGLRVPALNAAIGGSPRSDHCHGRAADIKVPDMSARDVCEIVRALRLPYRQLICEFGAWCHVSIPAPGDAPAREDLTAIKVAGRTEYHRGIA